MSLWNPLTRRALRRPLSERAHAYLSEIFPQRPAIRDRGAEIVGFAEIAEGTNSEIWRVDLDRGRLIARFWKIERGRDKAAETVELLQHLHTLGLPVPRLIDCDLSTKTARRFAMRVTVEEFLPGRHIEPADLRDVSIRRQLVDIFLRLHAETSETAGRPWRRNNRNHPWEAWLDRRIPLLVERIRMQRPGEIGGDLAEPILAMRPPERDTRPFALIHGDPQPANFLIDGSGHVGLIDFGTVMYAPFEIDLVIGHDCFDQLEPGSFDSVIEECLAASSERWRERWRRHARFYRALHLLERVSSCWRKAERYSADTAEWNRLRGDQAWQRLQATLAERTPR
ncbi:phosphotransferase [Candidatus Sumerlaeota bacterium]|nr:phosphotransferase [Candidatus Sumerlaeota bacterium]